VGNRELKKMKCPLCLQPVQLDEIKEILDCEDTYSKFIRFKEEHEVIKTADRKLCPTPDCQGVLKKENGANKATCPQCEKHFCFRCQHGWHEGKSCQEAEDEYYGDWAEHRMANKCPNCKARIEKEDGCPHMTCRVCYHEWCWVCGSKFDSTIHSMPIYCEMMNSILNSRFSNKCCLFLSTALFLIFLPVLALVICILLAGMLIAFIGTMVYKKFKRRTGFEFFKYRQGFIYKVLRVISIFLAVLIFVAWIALVAAFGLAGGAVLCSLVIFPAYIVVTIMTVKMVINWRHNHMV